MANTTWTCSAPGSMESMATVWPLFWQLSKLTLRTSMTGSSKTSFQLIEEKYLLLQDRFKLRDDLIRLQKFILLWRMTLLRLLVEESNVLSLDMQDGNRLVGVWLKKRDYAGKLKRKAMVNAMLQAQHEEDRATWRSKDSMKGPGVPWGPETVRTFGKQWDRSDYVRFLRPLIPPARWLSDVMKVKG